tara:strand:- start:53492 stop:53743 length:252 start_codon:yes stop_codon:yes gene_type:complete
MTIQYGLTLDNQMLISEKAKTKANGIYQFRGVSYRVIDNRARFFAANGRVIESAYGFNCDIGSYEMGINGIAAKAALRSIKEK